MHFWTTKGSSKKSEERKQEIKKYLEIHDNKKTTNQNLGNGEKAILRGDFYTNKTLYLHYTTFTLHYTTFTLHYIKTKERSQIT